MYNALNGDYIEKEWSNFHSLVARNTRAEIIPRKWTFEINERFSKGSNKK